VRAVRRLRLDMNFLMTVAIIGALIIGEPIEAAAITALFLLTELLGVAAVNRTRRSVDEANVTGQSVPVRKQAGDSVFTGSML
jgi:cation transport ATPase